MSEEIVKTDLPVSLAVLPEASGAIKIYEGASNLVLSVEEDVRLSKAVEEQDVQIRPDGLIYLPQVFFRDMLNTTFGRGQWALVQIGITQMGETLAFDGALYIRGKFVARAVGEADYHANNPQESWATAYESAKSDCLTRCCKDLGVAKELWMPQYVTKWIKEHAVKVWREKARNRQGQPVGAFQWRRRDSDPFYDEKGSPASQVKQEDANTGASQAQKVPITGTVGVEDKSKLKNEDYVIPFGFLKGKKLKEVDREKLNGAIAWVHKEKKESYYGEFLEKADAYLKDDGLSALDAVPVGIGSAPMPPTLSPQSGTSDLHAEEKLGEQNERFMLASIRSAKTTVSLDKVLAVCNDRYQTGDITTDQRQRVLDALNKKVDEFAAKKG